MNMTTTRKTFDRRCKEGIWECEYEPNKLGTAQIRVCSTGARITVTIRD